MSRQWELCLRRLRRMSVTAHEKCSRGEEMETTLDSDLILRAAGDLAFYTHDTGGNPFRNVWSAIGWKYITGLVALFCLAQRLSASSSAASASQRRAYESLCAKLENHLALFECELRFKRCKASTARTLGTALFRSQCLRCYARLLGERALELQTQQQEIGGQADAEDILKAQVRLLEGVCNSLSFFSAPEVLGSGDTYTLLLEELTCSGGLLEHFARTLLLVLPACERDAVAACCVAQVLWRMGCILASNSFQLSRGLPTTLPSLSYLLSSHLVRLAAALDGGTMYGTPAGAVLPPLLDTSGRRALEYSDALLDTKLAQAALTCWRLHIAEALSHLRPPEEPSIQEPSLRAAALRLLPDMRRRLAEMDAQGVPTTLEEFDAQQRRGDGPASYLFHVRAGCAYRVEVLEQVLASRAVPPFNVAATFDVSMRLAAAARAALSDPDPQPSPPQQPAEARPRLPQHQSVALGLKALRCAREAMWDVGWATAGETPPAKLQQLRGWWECAVGFTAEAIRCGPDAEQEHWRWTDLVPLLELRFEGMRRSGAVRPLAPTCDLATALGCGCVRLVEMLLRRAGAPHDVVVGRLFREPHCDSWRVALALADPADAAALLTTLTKLTRRVGTAHAAAIDSVTRTAGVTNAANSLLGRDQLGIAGPGGPRMDFMLKALRESLRLAAALLGALSRLMSPAWMKAVLEYCMMDPAVMVALRAPSAPAAAAAQIAPDAAAAAAGGGGGGALAGGAGDAHAAAAAAAAGDGGGPPAAADAVAEAAAEMAASRRAMGRNLSYMAVRLLPGVCELAFKLADELHRVEDQALGDHIDFSAGALTWIVLLQHLAIAEAQMAATCPDQGSETARRHREAAAAWQALLWDELRPTWVLGLALQVVERCNSSDEHSGGFMEHSWTTAVSELLRLDPTSLATALASSSSSSAAAAEGPRWRLTMPRLRRALRPTGMLAAPELLGKVERAYAAAVAAAAGRAAGGPVPSDADATAAAAAAPLPAETLWFAAHVPSPAEALAVVPVCGNPVCDRAEGDSEAGQRLLGCGRCGGRVRYCSKECQRAHWRAGHKAQCAGSGGGAAAAAGATAGAGGAGR